MSDTSVVHTSVRRVTAAGFDDAEDILAIEEPLEIRLAYRDNDVLVKKPVSITMRTPGDDIELALGFLFTEGIIKNYMEIDHVNHVAFSDNNVIEIQLKEGILPNISKLDRNFYTTSSCGVCGKASIDAIRVLCNTPVSKKDTRLPAELLPQLPQKLKSHQEVFNITGGLHASALFDMDANFLFSKEDVGRHNALDKLIGFALQQTILPLDNHILLLSGRASFELIQKAAMAGIRFIAAVGAPSSLAVSLAAESDITLIGFLRDNRFNIYSGIERITYNNETTH